MNLFGSFISYEMIRSRMRQSGVDHRHPVKKWTCWHRKASNTDDESAENVLFTEKQEEENKLLVWFFVKWVNDAIYITTLVTHYATVGDT
jgi:hypothetical protein